MKHGASHAIEIVEDQTQEVTLESVRNALLKIAPYKWHLSDTHFPEKQVLANGLNDIIIFFQTGLGCFYLEDYNTKKHTTIDILPSFTPDQVAELIEINLKRMGA